ncbi:GTP-binding protein Rhes [Eucyclogobius newberryi]|uniref:GTP-binding protein Rhes n=1 Tax=Eucyclogobius newberryi TaxID=166745 RepID=UPI003B5CFB16
MNSTEKGFLAFDSIFDLFSFTGHHPDAKLSPSRQHPSTFSLSKTGMNIVKAVHGCRGDTVKMTGSARSSSGQRQVSSIKHVKKSVDNMDLGRMNPQHCTRIVVLGAPKVGKTNLLQRFLGKDFKENYEPTREDFYRKLFHIEGETYRVDLLDAAGERDFPAKRRLSILTGDIFLLVFSLDDRESFREVCELLSEIKSAKTKFLKMKTPAKVPVVVCGNKADLGTQQRLVGRSEVLKTLSDDVTYVETSAKNSLGLEILFPTLARLGALPDETSPSRHEIVPILSYQSLCQRGRRHEPSAPCGAVDPLARRPSFTTDLKLVLGSSTKQNKPERCQIQ